MSTPSGISANEELLNTLAEAKQGSTRLVHMQIENEQIRLRNTVPISGSWQEDYDSNILPLLEPKAASYILYRLDSKNSLGHEWILLTWIPDETHVWQKTLYASTRATFRRQFGDGYLLDDILCHDEEDISLAGYMRHLTAKGAPVPLTQAEQQALEETSDHFSRASMNESHGSFGGISFSLTTEAEEAIKKLTAARVNYVQFTIDIPNEKITSSIAADNVKPEDINGLAPSKGGSYHLYRFTYSHEDRQLEAIYFVHAIAGYQSPVKERMLYSSCKGTLIDQLTCRFNIKIAHKLEIDDFRDLTSQFLIDIAHPRKEEAPLALPKPRGPSGRGPRRLIK